MNCCNSFKTNHFIVASMQARALFIKYTIIGKHHFYIGIIDEQTLKVLLYSLGRLCPVLGRQDSQTQSNHLFFPVLKFCCYL